MLSRNPSQINPHSITMVSCWEIFHKSIRKRKFKVSEFLNKHYEFVNALRWTLGRVVAIWIIFKQFYWEWNKKILCCYWEEGGFISIFWNTILSQHLQDCPRQNLTYELISPDLSRAALWFRFRFILKTW